MTEILPSSPTSLVGLWIMGDGVTQATLVLLGLMSVATWYILAVKLVEQAVWLRQAKTAGTLAEAATHPSSSAFGHLARAGLEAAHAYAEVAANIDRHTWISLAVNRVLSQAANRLQSGLAVLATVASTAPFIGLFGTVWGVHHALAAIGFSGQASIDKVAGPVGEALVMTALGLATAIPAVLAYNWLGRRNRRITESLRDRAAQWHVQLLGGHGAASPERPDGVAASLVVGMA